MAVEKIKQAVTELPNDIKHPIGMFKILIVISVTVLAIFAFKIPIWKPTKARYTRYKKRYTNYRQKRRSRRK